MYNMYILLKSSVKLSYYEHVANQHSVVKFLGVFLSILITPLSFLMKCPARPFHNNSLEGADAKALV